MTIDAIFSLFEAEPRERLRLRRSEGNGGDGHHANGEHGDGDEGYGEVHDERIGYNVDTRCRCRIYAAGALLYFILPDREHSFYLSTTYWPNTP